MPRLLALTTSQEDGGAEAYLRTIVAAAIDRGYDVTAALPRRQGTAALHDDLAAVGATVRTLGIGRQSPSKRGTLVAILADCVDVARTIAHVRPDAILLSLPTPEATPGAMLACALSQVHTVVVFHLVRADLNVTRRRRRLYALAHRDSQQWVCVSEDNRATLSRALGADVATLAVVRNGSALPSGERVSREQVRRALALAPDATVVLTTGRLNPQKDHHVIVEALPRLVALDRSLVFAWAGDGALRDDLSAAVSAAGLQAHVRFLGHRDDVPDLLGAADLFLLPSRHEGTPFALVEAMHSGLPTIVADAGALTEVVLDRRTGVVFARGDAADLVRAVGWALAHPAEMTAMAERARSVAHRDYTVEGMIDATLDLLSSTGARRRARHR